MNDIWDYGIHFVLIILWFLYQYGLIWGILYLIFAAWMFDQIIKCFGYERVVSTDIFQCYTREKFCTNICVFMEIDRITHKELQDKVFQRAITAIPRMSQVPVRICGMYFWKQVDLELAKAQIVKDDKVLKDENDAHQYMNELANQRLDYEKPQFEFRLVEDYTEESSIIYFRCIHTLGDGVGVSNLFATINDDQFEGTYEKKIFKPNLFEQVYLFFRSYYGYWNELCVIVGSMGTDAQAMKVIQPKTSVNPGDNYYQSSIEVPFGKVRKCYRQYQGMTFNDYMLAIIGKTLHETCEKHGIKDAKAMQAIIPVNFKVPPSGYHDLSITNNFTGFGINVPMEPDLQKSMNQMKPALKKLLDPYLLYQAKYYNGVVLPYFPAFYARPSAMGSMNGNDIVVSNIPFSRSEYSINGKVIKKMRFYNNTML